MYHPSSEKKGADQLRSYCEADLRLCFRLCRLSVFPCGGSYYNMFKQNNTITTWKRFCIKDSLCLYPAASLRNCFVISNRFAQIIMHVSDGYAAVMRELAEQTQSIVISVEYVYMIDPCFNI